MNLQTFNKLVSLLEIPMNHRQSLRSTSGNLPIEDHIYVSAGLRFLAGSMQVLLVVLPVMHKRTRHQSTASGAMVGKNGYILMVWRRWIYFDGMAPMDASILRSTLA
jgi:hypothetical protein